MATRQLGTLKCEYQTGLIMKPHRVVVLALAILAITVLAGIGMWQSPGGFGQTAVIAVTAIMAILLVFGVEIHRIEYGKLKVVFEGDSDE